MIKQIIILAVVGVILVLYATPVFYLKPGVDNDTPDDVSRYLGTPSQSTDNPDGTSVATYKVEKIPPLCVEYVLTFQNKLTSEDASQQAPAIMKTVVTKWDWRWCPSEKAEKKDQPSS